MQDPRAVLGSSAVQEPSPSCADSVSFASLMPVPHRDRPYTSRPRKKHPSYEITSDECIAFVEERSKPCKKKMLKLMGAKNTRQNGEECKRTGRTGKKELGKEQLKKNDKIVKRPTPKLTSAHTRCEVSTVETPVLRLNLMILLVSTVR